MHEAAVKRRTFISLLGAAAAIFIASAFAGVVITSAQTPEFPSKNVTLMMPYAAGGPGDTLTRIIGHGMGKVLANNSSWRTWPERAARSARRRSRRPRPMA